MPRSDAVRALRGVLLAAVSGTLLLGCVDGVGQGEGPLTSADPAYEDLRVDRDEGWFGRQLRVYRTYPHLDRATELEREGRLEAASREMERYLELDPADLRARAYHMSLLARLGRHEEAGRAADRILEARPEFVPALLHRAVARAATGRPGAAVDDYRSVAESAAADAADRRRALREWAELEIGRGQPERALEPLSRLQELEHAPRRSFRMGTIRRQAGRLDSAAADFADAAERAGSDSLRVRALAALAGVEEERSDPDAARAALDRALAVLPAADSLRLARARLSLRAGDPASAAGDLETLLRSDRELPAPEAEIRGELATAHDRAGRPAEAARALVRPGEAPSDPEVGLRAAGLWERAERPDSALRLAEEAAATAGGATAAEASERAGHLRFDRGEYRAAARSFEDALEERPDDPDLLAAAAGAWLEAGETETAVETYRRALRLAEEDGETPPSDAGGDSLALRLGEALTRADRRGEAREHYRRTRSAAAEGSDLRREAGRRLANLEAEAGRWGRAAELYLEAAADDPSALLAAAESFRAAGQPGRAAELYGRYLEEWPQGAEPAGGASRAEVLRRRGVSLYEADRPDEAVEPLRRAADEEPRARTSLYLARSLAAAGDTAGAVRRMAAALENGGLDPEQATAARVELGHLQRASGRPDEAVALWRRALDEGADPALRLQLARALLESERPEEALRALEEADDGRLTRGERVSRYELLAEARRRLGRAGDADALERAAALDSTSGRLRSLAYARLRAGEARAAARAFDAADRLGTTPVAARSDAAYAHLRAGDEEAAARWLRAAIDGLVARDTLAPAPAEAGDEPGESSAARLERLRRLHAELTRTASGGAYLSFRSDDGSGTTAPGGLAGGALPSQGGVDAAWRLPWVGYRDGRTAEAFARLLWGMEPGTLRFQESSYQASVGLQYRPFSSLGLVLSGERLIGIGDAARDTWLGRARWSWSTGVDPVCADDPVHYGTAYADAAWFSSGLSSAAAFGEVRQGVTLPLTGSTTLSPHAAGYLRWEDAGPGAGSYVEAGPGISLRSEIGGGRYRPYLGTAELLVQYRIGELLDPPAGTDGSMGGLVVTGVLRF